MSAKLHLFIPALSALALACFAPQACASDGSDWEWKVMPYIWAAGLTTDLHTSVPPIGGGTEQDFSDLIDKLDGAFQIHAEGQNEHWGMFGDFGFIGLAAEGEHGVFDTQSDMDVRLAELAGVWSPADGKYEGFEAFGGLRRVEVDFNTDFDPHNVLLPTTNFKFNQDYNDFLLGARYIAPLSDRWTLALRGDGSWGDTDGTWGASAMFSYKAGPGEWLMGYRTLTGKFKNDHSDLKLRLSGFEAGYAFRF